ncbi:MAG: M23 family metallopeptidase [Gammaproteobacteria bacterium]
MAGALNALQGTAIRLDIPDEPGLVRVEAHWRDRRVPFARADNWYTVLGVDLETEPGTHAIGLAFSYRDGSAKTGSVSVTVEPREFPVTRLKVAPKYVELSEANLARTAREREEINAIYDTLTPEPLWTESFDVPVAGAAGGRNFGHRRVFNQQPRAPHSGADLAAATGTPVHASNDGRVVVAGELFFSGNAVFLAHGLGIYSVYLHLSAIDVELGQRVSRGDVIGRAGATGRVTGAHLHWGVRVQGARVDPFSLLDLGAAR